MATSLPMFFGYDSDGSYQLALNDSSKEGNTIDSGDSKDNGTIIIGDKVIIKGGSTLVDVGGIPSSGIIHTIPSLDNPIWQRDPRY